MPPTCPIDVCQARKFENLRLNPKLALIVVVAICSVWSPAASAALLQSEASSAHSQHTRRPGYKQFKRVGQYTMKQLLLGETDEAIAYARQVLKERADDGGEIHFLLALALAQRGDIRQASDHLRTALDAGLPPGRLIAGPRKITDSIRQTEPYRGVMTQWQGDLGLIHGPLVGAVRPRSAVVWVRTLDAAPVRVWVAADPQQLTDEAIAAGGNEAAAGAAGAAGAAIGSESMATGPAGDYTAAIQVNGLQPDTKYYYRVMVGGKLRGDPNAQHFRTFPETGDTARFHIAFGGGAGYVPANERIWNTIRRFEPRALLLLGDNVYSDDPQSPEIQRYSYYRRQSRPEWRRLVSQTPVFSIWDDHDFSNNDSWGGSQPDYPDWKRRVWEVFQENWANPAYGMGAENPGCFYRFSIGDVELFMLDCRYYRNSPRLPEAQRSMLGAAQKRWLKKHLQKSKATFKILVSSVPWDFRTKGDSSDTWNGYRPERQEIFKWLAEHEIEGVVLMSADRHRSDAWRIDSPAGLPKGLYDLYEFNSSRLTNQHVHAEMPAAVFSYNDKQSFGIVTFDTTCPDPTVRYEVVNIDGETVHRLELNRSQLEID